MAGTWQEELRHRVTALPEKADEALVRRLASGNALPFAATNYWLALAGEDYRNCRKNDRGVPVDPILAQALPSAAEFERSEDETQDPLSENLHSPFPRVVHQYPSRILLRATGECPVFCRHCFRRSLLPHERGFMDDATQEYVESYLATHAEVREVLVSGGDPLTASTAKLEALFARIRAGRPDILIRLCTRSPVTLPARIDEELVAMLVRHKPLHVVIHINHPAEISALFREKIRLLVDAGLPVRSQTVLLAGINDTSEALVKLFSTLTHIGVDPYYLFQGDLAAGTAHFRVPLSRGLILYNELRQKLSGLELPHFAVDAPDGGGKMYLPESVIGQADGYWLLRGPDGSVHRYPEEGSGAQPASFPPPASLPLDGGGGL